MILRSVSSVFFNNSYARTSNWMLKNSSRTWLDVPLKAIGCRTFTTIPENTGNIGSGPATGTTTGIDKASTSTTVSKFLSDANSTLASERRLATDDMTSQDAVLPDKLYKTIELELLAYEPAVLDSYEWFLVTAASHLGIEVGRVWAPRKSDKYRFPLLKSAHVHKKHRVHYEIRTYHKFITLKKLTGSTASTYLEYIQRNIPEGIGMKVSRLEVLPKPSYVSALSSSVS